jgi:bisphosphoglycerate-independent phosphoglycerate mutase (AlkP superfamily)
MCLRASASLKAINRSRLVTRQRFAFDRFWATCPHSLLQASGHDVGLPQEQMGNGNAAKEATATLLV